MKKELLYSGKAKSLYTTDDPEVLLTVFRDDTTAFDGAKKAQLTHKGKTNNYINTHIMQLLAAADIPTHFIAQTGEIECVVKKLTMIPLESVIRNVAAGSLCRRLGLQSGRVLAQPLHEWFLKDDALHDPMVCAEHALVFGWATQEQLAQMKALTLKINQILVNMFATVGLTLVDAKFEFGVDVNGQVCLGDEISPDSCRIWDSQTQKKLDKDRFRQDLGGVMDAYRTVAMRLGIAIDE